MSITAAESSESRISGSVASLVAMAHPFSPSNISAHQPSKIEQFNPPLRAAFSPLVPDASLGRIGLFSQMSQPWTRYEAMSMS